LNRYARRLPTRTELPDYPPWAQAVGWLTVAGSAVLIGMIAFNLAAAFDGQ